MCSPQSELIICGKTVLCGAAVSAETRRVLARGVCCSLSCAKDKKDRQMILFWRFTWAKNGRKQEGKYFFVYVFFLLRFGQTTQAISQPMIITMGAYKSIMPCCVITSYPRGSCDADQNDRRCLVYRCMFARICRSLLLLARKLEFKSFFVSKFCANRTLFDS